MMKELNKSNYEIPNGIRWKNKLMKQMEEGKINEKENSKTFFLFFPRTVSYERNKNKK